MENIIPFIIIAIFKEYESIFSKIQFKYFVGYIWSVLICPNKKCLTNLSEVSFFIKKSVSGWSRFLGKTEIDTAAIQKKTVEIIFQNIESLVIQNGRVFSVLDTTLEAVFGKKISGVQKWKDHSGNSDRGNYLIGHHWGIMGILAKGLNRWFCLPLISRLIFGQKNPSFIAGEEGTRESNFWDVTLAMSYQMQDILKKAMTVIADAYFSKAIFINGLKEKGIELISRLRNDAVGWLKYEVPICEKRPVGRPRKKGEKVKLFNLLKTEPIVKEIVEIYGKLEEVAYVSMDLFIRDVKELVRVVIIVTGDSKPIILLSTDLGLSPIKIIEYYAARFSIETSIREMKSNLGIFDYQCYTTISMIRHVSFVNIAYTLWTLMSWLPKVKEWMKAFKLEMGKEHKYIEGGILYLRRLLRQLVFQKLIFSNLNSEAELNKFKLERELIYKKLCRFAQ
jgi:hypothetical protein